MRIKNWPLIFILTLVCSPHTVRACVCANPVVSDREAAAAEFRDAAVVFEGEVSASPKEIVVPTGTSLGVSMIQFRVLRAYKGNLGDSIQLFDPMAGTDCGSDNLRPGQRLFVYGFEGKDRKIYIQACSRTTFWDSAAPDIRFARNEPATKDDLAPPGEKWRLHRDPTLETRGASINGAVRRADCGDARGVFVTVWDVDENGARSPIGRVEAIQKVNADGSFEIRFLPPGKYNVTAEGAQIGSAVKCEGEYGNVVLAESQVLSHLNIKLTCKAVSDGAPK